MPSTAGGQQQRPKRRRKRKSKTLLVPTTMMGDAISNRTRGQRRKAEASNTWDRTPLPLFIRMLGYLDNATLMILCLVCKQIRDLIWDGHGMDNKLIRIFELRSLARGDNVGSSERLERFLANMTRYFNDPTKNRMLQQYQHMKIVHGIEDQSFDDEEFRYYDDYDDEFERMLRNISMAELVSLDVSSLVPVLRFPNILLHAISSMVPNLRELDLSNVVAEPDMILAEFSRNCRHIEIIKWNLHNYAIEKDEDFLETLPNANGWFVSDEMNNLRELYLDNRVFVFSEDISHHFENIRNAAYNGEEYDAMADLNKYPNIAFLNQGIRNKPLEKLSIRNAVAFTDGNWGGMDVISQDMLIKCVRNAPSTLVWFRSDLSEASIHLLQAERPGIEFVQ